LRVTVTEGALGRHSAILVKPYGGHGTCEGARAATDALKRIHTHPPGLLVLLDGINRTGRCTYGLLAMPAIDCIPAKAILTGDYPDMALNRRERSEVPVGASHFAAAAPSTTLRVVKQNTLLVRSLDHL